MSLTQINQEYDSIMQSNLTKNNRNFKLAMLMTQMEKQFHIPMLRNEEWEQNNKKLIALYRKISMSRVF
jgi:hypothetical protein